MAEEEELHPIFTKDPEEWMQYVYKKVIVMTDDGLEHAGLVYTIDPVSETFVLVNFNDEKVKLDLLLRHAISSVNVIGEVSDTIKQKLDKLFLSQRESEMTEEELKKRQGVVRAWLLKNRLPVEVGGVNGDLLSIADALVIRPPYGPDNCSSTNEIILGKIQGLIKNMPVDQDQW